LAQDDYWYEIHLSNKQLVFYFMAAATVLILSFLAGVMVGRGVDANTEPALASTRAPRAEEKVITEEAPARVTPPSPEELTYAQRLESEKAEDALDKPGTVAGRVAPPRLTPAPAAATPAPRPVATPATPAPRPTATPARATPAPPRAVTPPPAASGSFAIQVGAFKDRAGADALAARLKGKGLPAQVLTAGDLFNVRVGPYTSRPDAEQVQNRLRDQEALKPFIVRN
jgi:cell division protein FtsN